MKDEPKNFIEFAEQYRPQTGTERSWGTYFAALAGAGIVDAGFAIKGALTPVPPVKPLYIPEKTEPLYQLARETIEGLKLPKAGQFGVAFVRQFQERLAYATYPNVFLRLVDMAEDIFTYAQPHLPAPLPPLLDSDITGARYRDQLRELILFAQAFSPITVLGVVSDIAVAFMAGMPQLARIDWDELKAMVEQDDAPTGLTVELNDIVLNLPGVVESMLLLFYRAEHMSSGLFQILRDQLDQNVCAASGLAFTDENRWGNKLVLPTKYKGSDLVETYLRNTPLIQVFE